MLWRAELKKLLVVKKGAVILLVCLLAKTLLLWFWPEMKDPRISLSQNQYNKYLNQLYGESTVEKNEWARQEYEWCLETIGLRESMEKQYAEHDISEDEYQEYTEKLETAYLHRNSAQIFSEKAAQFQVQDERLPPAHYIYEYGWQTIFHLQQFPDIFLLFGLLLMAAQCYTMESATGMLPVLLSAKNGKSRLFYAKLFAMLAVGVMSALLFSGAEALLFCLRGWFSDAQAPIYSVSITTECSLPLSLGAGYAMAVLIRIFAALLLSAVVYGLSVWVRNPINTVFAGMCLAILPLLLGRDLALYTHSGLMCGTRVLNGIEWGIAVMLPVAVVLVYSGVVLFLAARKHGRGM